MIPILSQNDFEFFKKLCKMSQYELLQYVSRYLVRYYDKIVTTNKYVWAQGKIPITLVAHLDTVFDEAPSRIYYDREENVIWSPDGLGADDRAGVFGILALVSSGFYPNVIFTTDEEIMCQGALALTNDYKECPFPTNYMIELDKAGANIATFYQCNTHKFIDYVTKFDFCTMPGSYSDIKPLMRNWRICGVNLGIGYYLEHSNLEHLNVSEFFDTIRKVKRMLSVKRVPKFPYFEEERVEIEDGSKRYYI